VLEVLSWYENQLCWGNQWCGQEVNITRENAKGNAEYIPAARSLYDTNLSMEITGWTEVALVIPMKRTAAYMAPMALNISCWVSLANYKAALWSAHSEHHYVQVRQKISAGTIRTYLLEPNFQQIVPNIKDMMTV
jgi:hypothetical protein